MSVLPVGFGSAAGGGFNVERSLRFNSADSAYLNRTPASAGNRRTWTWSGWVKKSVIAGDYPPLFNAGQSAPDTVLRFSNTDTITAILENGGGGNSGLYTTQVFRDPSAWYHIVWAVDTTQATANDRQRLYVNGVEVTAFSTRTNPTQNLDTNVNNTVQHRIGGQRYASYFNGYLAEVNFIDGLALTPAYFGFNNSDTGAWSPKQYTGAYGTNGFFLPFNVDITNFSVDYLVIAGGGGGGGSNGGGGAGAGGYRESTLSAAIGTTHTVTVGAGGTGGPASGAGSNGSNSVFSSITSTGGGAAKYNADGNSGGSGGGGGGNGRSGGAGTSGQGNAGGTGAGTFFTGGGGGGAGSAGSNADANNGGNGGSGTTSSISGSAVGRAGGGGGGTDFRNSSPVAGTASSGGGAGSVTTAGTAGTANTGGGGGGGGYNGSLWNGGTGGSGVVIIKVPNYITASFSGGVTSSLSTSVAGFNIYTVTATSTTSETVTFS